MTVPVGGWVSISKFLADLKTLKSGGVVIRMVQDLSEVEYCVPDNPDFQSIFGAKGYTPFCDEVTAFLDALSACLMRDEQARNFPDVVSFAFWCRAGALRAMKASYSDHELRLGRGIVFHVAPSNVPMNFAYSLVVGLLAGNVNIVRVPSRDFPQIQIICSTIRALLGQEKFRQLLNHIVLVRYEKNDAITDFFSEHCDVRVIWGGDQTINNIRRSPLPPRSFDLTFADRYSLCVINADVYPGKDDPAQIARDFYNDTYLFDQNACTSPHMVVWVGSARNVEKAKKLFWHNLHLIVAEKYKLQPVSSVNKLVDAYRFAANSSACHVQKMEDNLIVRVQLEHLIDGLEDARSMCGYFYEYTADTLNEIAVLINRKFQTLVYYGMDLDVMRQFIEQCRPTGIDRIVPIGRTLEFSLVWDGYDLIYQLSRKVSL
jgi:hypothetical protein